MAEISVGEYTDDRRESLIEMILEIQRKEFQIPITREDQPDLAAIPRFYQQGNGNFWVALCDGQVVGSVGLLDIGNQQVALRKMFVQAGFRGGVGRGAVGGRGGFARHVRRSGMGSPQRLTPADWRRQWSRRARGRLRVHHRRWSSGWALALIQWARAANVFFHVGRTNDCV